MEPDSLVRPDSSGLRPDPGGASSEVPCDHGRVAVEGKRDGIALRAHIRLRKPGPLGPFLPAPRPDPGCTGPDGPSDNGRVAIARQSHGSTLAGGAGDGIHEVARTNQLVALLSPDSSAPCPHPRGPLCEEVIGRVASGNEWVVVECTDNRGVAVGGKGHGTALSCTRRATLHHADRSARADQLLPLLGPDAPAPRPDPYCPNTVVVEIISDDGRFPVAGEGYGYMFV